MQETLLDSGSGRSAGDGIGHPLQHSWASLVAQLVKNLPATWETWVWSLGWEDPLEKGTATHSVFWPGDFHGLYIPWGHKESDTTERLSLWWVQSGLPQRLSAKEPSRQRRRHGSVPGSGRSLEGGNGHPLQYSCLESPLDRGAQRVTLPRESQRVGHGWGHTHKLQSAHWKTDK